MWNEGVISLLAPLSGDLGGHAYEINDAGNAVGFSMAADFSVKAVLWLDESTYDLNSLLIDGEGWLSSQALSINERGRITGWGSLGGLWLSFLLTPAPEPKSFLMLLTGLGLLASRPKRLGAVT